MNSGPTGPVIVVSRIRSISCIAEASSDQPMTSRNGLDLIGPARAPERDCAALVENPAHCEREHALAVALAREPVERIDGGQILAQARLLELRIRSCAGRRL